MIESVQVQHASPGLAKCMKVPAWEVSKHSWHLLGSRGFRSWNLWKPRLRSYEMPECCWLLAAEQTPSTLERNVYEEIRSWKCIKSKCPSDPRAQWLLKAQAIWSSFVFSLDEDVAIGGLFWLADLPAASEAAFRLFFRCWLQSETTKLDRGCNSRS